MLTRVELKLQPSFNPNYYETYIMQRNQYDNKCYNISTVYKINILSVLRITILANYLILYSIDLSKLRAFNWLTHVTELSITNVALPSL